MVPLGLFLVLAVAGAFREVEFKNCKPASGTLSCKVKSVEVSGCRPPSSWVDADGAVVVYQDKDVKRPCRMESGSSLNFTITYEPGFSADTMRSQFTLPDLPDCWGVSNHLGSLCPLAAAPQLACSHTKCPLQVGVPMRFQSSVLVNPEAAHRPLNDRKIYQMRWKLWDNKDKKHTCCFNIPVQY